VWGDRYYWKIGQSKN